MSDTLPANDIIGLVRNAVETARKEQCLVGSENIGEVIDLKLTVDLNSQGIERLPDEAVNILKREVERYVGWTIEKVMLVFLEEDDSKK